MEEEECGAEFQEELQRRLCSPAGSMSWLPRRVFIRLQGGTRKKRESRNKGSLTEEERGVTPERPRGSEMFKQKHSLRELNKVCVSDNITALHYRHCPVDGTLQTQMNTFQCRCV